MSTGQVIALPTRDELSARHEAERHVRRHFLEWLAGGNPVRGECLNALFDATMNLVVAGERNIATARSAALQAVARKAIEEHIARLDSTKLGVFVTTVLDLPNVHEVLTKDQCVRLHDEPNFIHSICAKLSDAQFCALLGETE